MKRFLFAALLLALAMLLSGCTAIDQALGKIGDDIEAKQVKESTVSAAAGDWGFVVTLREHASALFLESFPEAKVLDTAVATKSNIGERVIVTLTVELNGKKLEYGFDYEKNAAGEYEIKRYGEGVNSGDL
ncbi:MAG: hypothetical protein IKU34_08060 [Clostridia bacterium]|nr:hypothetical protein [Clostridia bacterium]